MVLRETWEQTKPKFYIAFLTLREDKERVLNEKNIYLIVSFLN